MKCPVCSDVRMREVEKNGVHIDACPDCKGVWLDRGELDKLMSGIREVRQEYNSWHSDDDDDDDRNKQRDRDKSYDSNRDRERTYTEKYGKPKKKNSVLDVLSDLF